MGKVKMTITVLGGLGLIWTAFMTMDTRYALAKDANNNKQQIQIIRTEQTYEKAMDDYYLYKDLSRKYPRDQKIKDELVKTETNMQYLKNKIKTLEDKIEE